MGDLENNNMQSFQLIPTSFRKTWIINLIWSESWIYYTFMRYSNIQLHCITDLHTDNKNFISKRV